MNGASGHYLENATTASAITSRIRPPADTARAGLIAQRAEGTLGLPFGVDPFDPAKARWAVVVPESEAAVVADGLAPLIAHRQGKVLTWKAGETRGGWLARHDVAAGSVIPDRVPFYLLLAGSAAAFPFSFAHELAIEYAVGRLEMSRDEYRRYAECVVRYECGGAPATARRAAFFGPRHEFDGATKLSADYLLAPLTDPASEFAAVADTGFTCSVDIGPSATKCRLREILSEPDGQRPSLLFTAGHGVGYPLGDPDQREWQGALVCQEWQGPGDLPDDALFGAEDVPEKDLDGLVAFLFACYGAGTPAHDRFGDTSGPPEQIADPPFVAALPQRLLLQGALAVAGHVDRAWGYSIVPPEAGAQVQPFRNFIGHVLTGMPVGAAMKDFRDRYAALTVSLANVLARPYEPIPDDDLVRLWTERNDAEGYLVVGDPAVRLRSRDIGGAP